jgi:nucleoside-diphosphate-sugar epimerase
VGGRVLVTGGGGLIGSHLVDALLARGDHVTVVDLCGIDLSVTASQGRP